MAFNDAEVFDGSGSQLYNATDFLWTVRVQGRGDFQTKSEVIQDRANLGDLGPRVTAAGRTGLVGLGAAYQAELNRQLDPVFRNVLRLALKPAGDPRANWHHIYKYFQDGSHTFLARTPGLATLPGGETTSGKGGASAIVGDSTIIRLAVDRYANKLDAGNGAVAWTAECVTDQTNGATKFSEVIVFESDTSLTIFHRGPVGERQSITIPNNGGGILKKASFKLGNAAVASGDITDAAVSPWVDDSLVPNNYALLTTPVYREAQSESGTNANALSMQWVGNTTLYQNITTTLKRGVPYLYGGSFYTKDACDRTVTVSLGTQSGIAFNMNGQTTNTWFLKYATVDENLFLDNFQPVDGTTALKLSVAVTTGTGSNTGTVVADNMFMIEGIPLNGTWIWLIPGQVPHALEDKWTFTDAAPSLNGKMATLIQEWAGVHVPTVTSVNSVVEPA